MEHITTECANAQPNANTRDALRQTRRIYSSFVRGDDLQQEPGPDSGDEEEEHARQEAEAAAAEGGADETAAAAAAATRDADLEEASRAERIRM
jgi:hypothetical protein